ncbi:trypsin-like peptidase domain-containing protein [Streptomyces sp. CAU 1734]|uniref:S1C family serine protease n=1 Tax=Streptomyces sp. CAU 1734 TaxID=3140360 RepID=UPI0032611C17
MTDHYRDQAHEAHPPYHPQAYDAAAGAPWAAYPPPPAEPPAAAPRHRGRGRRPIGLVLAVAVLAASIGGGVSVLIDRAAGSEAARGSTGISGTTVSTTSAGTVAGVAQALMPSIVEIRAGQSTGSGVIITSDGEIVTNSHVLSGAQTVQVRLSDGKTYTADVIGTEPEKDLALIKLRGASGLRAAALGDSKDVKVGEEVVAIGSPEGLTGTVTSGIVSALDRDVTVAKEPDRAQRQQRQDGTGWPFEFGGRQFNGDTGESKTTYKAIQTDASLNPGNSGGALINMRGEIIGINSAMYSPSAANGAAGSVGLGFAIPVDTVKDSLGDLRAGG